VEALPVEPHDAPLDGFSSPDSVVWGSRRTTHSPLGLGDN
jgi:hypothetical protein